MTFSAPTAPTAPTIEAASFLAELEGRGVTLYATEEGKLRFRPKSALSPKEIERLKEYKTELLQLVVYRGELSTVTTVTTVTPIGKTDTYGVLRNDSPSDSLGDSLSDIPSDQLPLQVRRELESASKLGLVAQWSYESGYVAIHDPTTGEWHDLPTKGVALPATPGWAKREALRRTELYREKGIRRLLTSREMQELWDKEHPIADEHPATDPATDPKPVSEGGLVYLDYLEGEG